MYPDNLKPFKGGKKKEMVGFCIILSKGLDRMEKEKVSFSLQWLVSFYLWLCSLCRSTNQHTNTLCFRHLLCGPCLLTPYVPTRTWVSVPAWHACAVFAGYKDLQRHSFKYEGFSLLLFFFFFARLVIHWLCLSLIRPCHLHFHHWPQIFIVTS